MSAGEGQARDVRAAELVERYDTARDALTSLGEGAPALHLAGAIRRAHHAFGDLQRAGLDDVARALPRVCEVAR
ncbi:MAG: hypothetical protein GY871_04715 [Actinomycetales bacterium]|nr:hypothetical protein [Actinomycetales bacterium]